MKWSKNGMFMELNMLSRMERRHDNYDGGFPSGSFQSMLLIALHAWVRWVIQIVTPAVDIGHTGSAQFTPSHWRQVWWWTEGLVHLRGRVTHILTWETLIMTWRRRQLTVSRLSTIPHIYFLSMFVGVSPHLLSPLHDERYSVCVVTKPRQQQLSHLYLTLQLWWWHSDVHRVLSNMERPSNMSVQKICFYDK